jgi:hypothetical protein
MKRLLWFVWFCVRDTVKWTLLVAYYVSTAPIGVFCYVFPIGPSIADQTGDLTWNWLPHGFRLWVAEAVRDGVHDKWQEAEQMSVRTAAMQDSDVLLRVAK